MYFLLELGPGPYRQELSAMNLLAGIFLAIVHLQVGVRQLSSPRAGAAAPPRSNKDEHPQSHSPGSFGV